MAGKLNLNLALQPSTASTAKIQIHFSRHWTKDFFGEFLRKIRLYIKLIISRILAQKFANRSPKTLFNESCKGICFYETRQKIFRLLGGKIEFEFWPLWQCWAVGPIQT